MRGTQRPKGLRGAFWGRTGLAVAVVVTTTALGLGWAHKAHAAGNFNLLITPSPLVATLKPGTTTDLELKIRNGGTDTEVLKIEPRSFKVNNDTGQVTLNDTSPADITSWLRFSDPTFTVQPGQWFTEKVRIALPKDTGFSYSFALLIARKDAPAPVAGQRLLNGSVADFTLVNVDRPGATRKLEVSKLTTSKGVYEYLPATINVRFKNTGNSIVQPFGNIFIQRGSNDKVPIATLPVNETRGYILPGSDRLLTTDWTSGFPVYATSVTSTTDKKTSLKWDFGDVSRFRLGRYTAKLVAVYDNGHGDVPIQQEVNFWVFPWKILLGLLIVVLLVLFGLWSFVRKIIRLGRKFRRTGKSAPPPADQNTKQ